MKPNSYHYFKVKVLSGSYRIEFDSIREFHRFAENHNMKSVFLITNEDAKASHFAIAHQGGLLQQSTLGFQSIEDYFISAQNEFPDAAAFYEARNLGYTSYGEFKLVKEAGISSKEEYDKVKEGGYIAGLEEWKKEQKDGKPSGLSFLNPYEMYKHALQKGFASYQEFKEAHQIGFEEAELYRVAKEGKFNSREVFEKARRAGVLTAEDWNTLQESGARDAEDFNRMIELKFVQGNTEFSFDQSLLLVNLSKLPDDKKVSINKLSELFEKSKEEYRYKDTHEMPKWFTMNLNDRAAMIHFLSTDNVKAYGHYDHDGEFFETRKLRDRDVVIDGSNVAFNTQGKEKPKPKAENILILVKELKNLGFNDITVIVDASLKHRLEDSHRVKEIKEFAKYLEAPAENPADIFIINYVKRTHCLLVSNDTFRDWKNKDAWVAGNIDFYRMSFMINGATVLLPDMKGKGSA